MNSDYEFRIVDCHHDSNRIAAYLPKVAWVTIRISVDLHWIRDHPEHLALSPTFPAHFILRVASKTHVPPRARQMGSLPPQTRETPILRSRVVDFGGPRRYCRRRRRRRRVHWYEGRSHERKAEIAKRIEEALVEVAGALPDHCWVKFDDSAKAGLHHRRENGVARGCSRSSARTGGWSSASKGNSSF
jgi:hypothetical protein